MIESTIGLSQSCFCLSLKWLCHIIIQYVYTIIYVNINKYNIALDKSILIVYNLNCISISNNCETYTNIFSLISINLGLLIST